MSYASDAENLASQQPPCQVPQPGGWDTECKPGCAHEQLLIARAQVFVLLGISEHLDTIGAQLADISSRQ